MSLIRRIFDPGKIRPRMDKLIVVSGWLAGGETAWQAAKPIIKVMPYEMQPDLSTGAYTTQLLGGFISSYSLGLLIPDRASGLRIEEHQKIRSFLSNRVYTAGLPAGGALALEQLRFAHSLVGG
jgi:methylenetetrahydrofolate--tRNA-(uracil-5-)-methyltransferase